MPSRTVILLAGPSGSGKSRLTRTTGAAQLRLDDFYLDESPGMPRREGRIDWDDVRTWDASAAVKALRTLLDEGSCEVPDYSISLSRRTGSRRLDLGPATVVIAEGIFAPDLLAHCTEAGVPVTPVWLDRHRFTNFWRRLRRDLAQHRKPVVFLLQRGAMLFRDEPRLRARAVGLGFRPMRMGQAEALVRELQAAGDDQ